MKEILLYCTACDYDKPLKDFHTNRYNIHRYCKQQYCKLCMCEKMNKIHAENPEDNRARVSKWQKDHPDRYRETMRKGAKKYYRKNVFNYKAGDANATARKHRRPGKLTGEEIKKLFQSQNWKCASKNCKNRNAPLTLDHVIPFSDPLCRNVIANCQGLCKPCNTRKAMLEQTYRAKTYIVIYPDGTRKKIKNLAKFSRQNNLNTFTMHQVAGGFCKTHQGFKVERV